MTSPPEQYDCVVIGGGPAGATVATLLSDARRSVLLLERSAFPRHHVGESLMPETYRVFDRLGMLDKLRATDFPRKESVQFVSASGTESQPFYFTDRDPNEWSVTWQVTRDRFDRMMLDNAREHGVGVREGARVAKVLFDGARAIGVRAEINGKSTEIGAQVIIDATGQSGVISRQLNLRYRDDNLRNASIYGYFKGARRDTGRNAGATIIINHPQADGWFWFIPLAGGVTSIGVVAPPSYLCTGRGDDPRAALMEEIAGSPGLSERLANAELVSNAYVTSDYSYHTRRISGDGWVLVGDAFGFLDPIYSSGVMVALKSGEFAADAVNDALENDDISADRLGHFAPRLLAGIEYIRKLIYAYYDRDFRIGAFLLKHPEYHDHVVRVLIGDVFDGGLGELFDCMGRYTALPKPLTLEGLRKEPTA